MESYVEFKKQNYTYIGKNSQLQGSIKLTGTSYLLGVVTGEIQMEDKSKLTLESMSEVNGKIEAHDVDVFGKIEGKIHATGTVTLMPNSQFDGEIKAKNLIIHPGASVNMNGHTD